MNIASESQEEIVLSGKLFDYWKKHSGLIETLAEIDEDSDELVLERDWFTHFDINGQRYDVLSDTEWRFFTDILTGGQVALEMKSNGKYVLNHTKGYSRPVVEKVLDYLMYDKPATMVNRFKTNILPFSVKVIARGSAPQKVAASKAAAAAALEALEDRNNNYNNYNNNNNNNYTNFPTKKNKYRSNIVINNNNNYKPYAKTLQSSKGIKRFRKTRRSNKTMRRRKD